LVSIIFYGFSFLTKPCDFLW